MSTSETQEAADEAINKVNGNVISGRVVYVGNFVKRGERMSSQQWTNLYIKNIPDQWDDEKITEMFSKFGKISSAIFVKNEEAKDKDGNLRRFGYVDFEEHEAAAAAVEQMHGMELPLAEAEAARRAEAAALAEAAKDKADEEKTDEEKAAEAEAARKPQTLYVQRFMKKRERERVVIEAKSKEKTERIKMFLGKNLYIRNLADEVTDEQLRAEFAPFGTITSARVMRDEVRDSLSTTFSTSPAQLPNPNFAASNPLLTLAPLPTRYPANGVAEHQPNRT